MIANKINTTLYTGVTSNLSQRSHQHLNKMVKGFTSKYNCTKLVWYEVHENAESAISREKQIKKWRRDKKDFLVDQMNPEWKDLSHEIF